jgi:hypothetical protein
MPMHNLVNRALVAVEGKDHWPVGSEQLDEARRVHAVGMVLTREGRHQVYNVHQPHLHLGHARAQPVRGRHRFERCRIARTG